MAFNDILADRVRRIFDDMAMSVKEKKMMGGLTFMVNDKMCVGISNDDLMARIAPEEYEAALAKKGCRQMDFTGRPMKGFVFVAPEATASDNELHYWIDLALAFNERARSYKRKKKSRT